MNGFNYETALARLEEISKKMSDETTTLDETVVLYTEAAKLIADINAALAEAKLIIEKADRLAENKNEL